MSTSSRLARNVLVLGVSQVVSLALGFVLWVHLGRALGAERLGMLAFGMALAAYFVLLVALGFDQVGVREIARDSGREAEIVPHLVGIRLVLGALATAAFVGLALVLDLEGVYQTVVVVMAGLVVARAVQLDWVYQAREQMQVGAVRNAAAVAVTAGIALGLVRGPEDLVTAAVAVAAGPVVANLGLAAYYALEVGVPRPRFERAAWLALAAPAVPLAASTLVSQVYYNADKLMLEAFRTTAEVGLYEAAYKMYSLGIAPAAVLSVAFFPVLSGALGKDGAVRREGRRYGEALLSLGPPLCLAGVVLAPGVLEVVFGAEYLPATPAFRILLGYAGLVYLSMTFGTALMAWNAEKSYFKAVLGGGIANVILNLALIAPLGPTGAAWATLLSEAVVMVGMAVRYRRLTGTLHADMIARAGVVAVAGGLVPALAGVALGLPLAASIALVLAATAVAIRLSGLAAPKDLVAVLLRRPVAP